MGLTELRKTLLKTRICCEKFVKFRRGLCQVCGKNVGSNRSANVLQASRYRVCFVNHCLWSNSSLKGSERPELESVKRANCATTN